MRRSPDLDLTEAVGALAELSEAVQRGRAVVCVARLHEGTGELAEVIAQCEGPPLVLLVPEPRVVALRALQAGAAAVLESSPRAERLAAAVASVGQGLVAIPAGVLADSPVEPNAPAEPLTPREREILSLLAAGDSNKTIAARLVVSVHTVKFHLSSIFSKLGVSSRTEAVALALRLGIVLL